MLFFKVKKWINGIYYSDKIYFRFKKYFSVVEHKYFTKILYGYTVAFPAVTYYINIITIFFSLYITNTFSCYTIII